MVAEHALFSRPFFCPFILCSLFIHQQTCCHATRINTDSTSDWRSTAGTLAVGLVPSIFSNPEIKIMLAKCLIRPYLTNGLPVSHACHDSLKTLAWINVDYSMHGRETINRIVSIVKNTVSSSTNFMCGQRPPLSSSRSIDWYNNLVTFLLPAFCY
jgi:hypothetical protein